MEQELKASQEATVALEEVDELRQRLEWEKSNTKTCVR